MTVTVLSELSCAGSARWTRESLADLCEEKVLTRDPSRMPDDEFSYIDISSIDDRKRICDPKFLFGRDAPSRARQVVQTGDVLVATTRPNLNAVALVPPELDGQIASTGFCVLRPSERLLGRYLYYFCRSAEFVASLSNLVRGALYPAVTDGQVKAQTIPVPPVSEQRRIVQRIERQLEWIEHAYVAADTQMGACDRLPYAILREAFYRITPLHAGEGRQDDAPAGWRWVELTKVARLESGHTPSRRHPEYWGGDVPWIALPDIRDLDGKAAMHTIECTNAAGIENSSARVLPEDTVVLSRTASVGFVTIMGRPMATSQDFVNWVCGPDLDPWFLVYLLTASRDYVRGIASGAVHKTIYMPAVKAFNICVPRIGEQRKIAAQVRGRLEQAERLSAAARVTRETLETMPSILLHDAFNGAT